MIRTAIAVAAATAWMAGIALAQQQQQPAAPPPVDFSKRKPFADLDAKWAPTELASTNFIRVVYHSLADKSEAKKTLLKRILHRS